MTRLRRWLPGVLVLSSVILWLARPEPSDGHGLRLSAWESATPAGEPAWTGICRRLSISMDGNPASSREVDYALRFEGRLVADTGGLYRFATDSDDGSALYLDERQVVENGGVHVRARREGVVHLEPGEHRLRLEYRQTVGESFLEVSWQPPGQNSFSPLPLSVLLPPESATTPTGSGTLRATLTAFSALLLAAGLTLLARRACRAIRGRDRSQLISLARGWTTRPAFWDLAAIAICLPFYLHSVFSRLPFESYMKGDSPYYALAALSLVRDGDLEMHDQTDRRIFENPWPGANIPMSHSNVAQGVGGAWYPKHPALMPVLSAPFYALGGGRGLLGFNFLALLVMVAATRRLAARFAPEPVATAAAAIIGLTPLFVHFSYSYSADIPAAALVAAGFALLYGDRPLLSGVAFALAIWLKPINVLAPLAAGLSLLPARRFRDLLRLVIGGAIGALPMAILHWHQFGSPWLSGYQRTLVVEGGHRAVASHLGGFTFPFWEGLRLQLFDLNHGLFATAGAALLAPLGFFFFHRGARAAGAAIGVFALGTFLLYCNYDFVTGSHYGNRFLMPVIATLSAPLALLLERLSRRWSSSQSLRRVA
ncbi:MAG: DUF2029 domain-containing protein [Myxococcales bacterium]|nr:DUF2029 domain-containing protein [Myxococcales bacterium]